LLGKHLLLGVREQSALCSRIFFAGDPPETDSNDSLSRDNSLLAIESDGTLAPRPVAAGRRGDWARAWLRRENSLLAK